MFWKGMSSAYLRSAKAVSKVIELGETTEGSLEESNYIQGQQRVIVSVETKVEETTCL